MGEKFHSVRYSYGLHASDVVVLKAMVMMTCRANIKSISTVISPRWTFGGMVVGDNLLARRCCQGGIVEIETPIDLCICRYCWIDPGGP